MSRLMKGCARSGCSRAIAPLDVVVDADSMERWIEQACATAHEAATIVKRLDSPRVRQHLVEFHHAAEPYANNAAVREFDTKYRELIMSTISAWPNNIN
ncbi:MAG: hypothetical protein ACRDTJ_11850, partial [Pseudonocardiaceae bacterium]